MIKFPVIVLCAFILFACTDERKLYNTLSEVESYIETEPEKALIEYEISEGVIVAKRHIHMTKADAAEMGIVD